MGTFGDVLFLSTFLVSSPFWDICPPENAVTIASYTYDGNGIRLSKTVNDITTNFINDGGYVVGEVCGDSIVKYTYGNNLISIDNNGTLGYYHTDEHGNVSAISDTSRNVVADYDFDAFGNETVSTDTYYNPMRYCGEYYDAETGLIYLRARYYDPSIGRFISEDPHWNLGNMIYGDKEYEEDEIKQPDIQAISQASNLYMYCLNNPLKYADPSGESYALAWGGSTWWIAGVDGPLPIGEAVYVGGALVAAALDGAIFLASRNNQRGLEQGMSRNQKEKFQRELEDYKKQMGRGPGDHLPWAILVEIANHIKESYK